VNKGAVVTISGINTAFPMQPTALSSDQKSTFLRRFSKLTCFSTLFLIFVGGMVTSTGSGLSVPDWPTTYGYFMFSFPLDQMVGGIRYEHTHRMVASIVGLFMLILSIALAVKEQRRWVKILGFWALAAVIIQGILGGLTVRFFLPPPVSIGHGVLAQTFFIMTIILAYSQSLERAKRVHSTTEGNVSANFFKVAVVLFVLVYCQLIIGAIMRHTKSGLAIPDFPTMGGYWLPPFNQTMLDRLNQTRQDLSWQLGVQFDPVTMAQVFIHFLHRFFALLITSTVVALDVLASKSSLEPRLKGTLFLLNIALIIQITLGIITVLSLKPPVITSLHVVTGGAMLGLSVLFLLRLSPLSWTNFKRIVLQ
jgi:cytochrome c oxidase assembly protein subunit 15